MPTYYNKITVMDGNSVIREIDLSQDTVASASDIMSGKYGHLNTGERVLGTGQGGGTPSATAHTIVFEFSDSTSTTLTGYWDSAFISDAIRATNPTEYGGKTVNSASLDGVEWYSYDPTSTIPLNTQLIDFNALTDGYTVGDDGSLTATEWFAVTDYTEIDPSMTFSYKGARWFYLGFYDSSKVAISALSIYSDGTVDPENENLATGTLTPAKIPANAKYVRISCVQGADEDYVSLIRTA